MLAKMNWDVFICHASEDKDALVRALAVALRSLGVSVWYDEFSLRPGDSISRSIDRGIAGSRYGLVVISTAFLSKRWPEHELRGLVSREIAEDAVIIPIWHGVQQRDVLRFSPSLADKIAIKTHGLEAAEVAFQILRVVKPDLYRQHPRADLLRIASGEAMAELQEQIDDLSARLEPFECPTCGAPLVGMHEYDHDYGSDVIEIFECGYESGGRHPCPSDPAFPRLRDYEITSAQLPEENPHHPWRCLLIPQTLMAKRLGIFGGWGRTEDEAIQAALSTDSQSARTWGGS